MTQVGLFCHPALMRAAVYVKVTFCAGISWGVGFANADSLIVCVQRTVLARTFARGRIQSCTQTSSNQHEGLSRHIASISICSTGNYVKSQR